MATQLSQKPFTTQVRFSCDIEGCIRGNSVSIPPTVKADNQVRLDYARSAATANGTWQVSPVVLCPDHIS